MGWLRDFMTGAEPPVPSFGRLAHLCLEHPQWPEDSRPKPRSLSTLFSKLDRNQDLDWLRDRIEVQQVLSQLLGRPLGSIRDAIGESPYESDPRFLRMHDVRYARDLDLAREPLPPGIPLDALTPPSWECTWWWAPGGAGRSLAAQWLTARGLAHTARVRAGSDLDALPPRGALFVDVESGADPRQLELTTEQLRRLRAHERPLCIAAPFGPPSSDFRLLLSPSATEFLPELIDWVDTRLDGSGHFQPDRAEQWMRKVALPSGAVRTVGDALGLLGMLDELSPRALLGKGLDELGAYFLRERIRETSERHTHAPRLPESAYGAMRAGAARLLVGGSRTLGDEHSLEEWTTYFSTPQNADQPDPQWFTDALRGALGNRISRRDLRRAASHLEPAAFQLTRALESAGILVRPPSSLVRDEGGAIRKLHPRWLVRLLEARAFEEALSLSPVAWGKVLFEGRDAAFLIEALLTRARSGHFEPLFLLVEDFDEGSGEHCAALEAATIVCGLLLLQGSEVPEDLLEGLVEHTLATALILDGLPYPRLTTGSPLAGLFTQDLWLTSLCAIAQEIPFSIPHLDPLRSSAEKLREHFESALLRCLQEALAHPKERLLGILSLLNTLTVRTSQRPAALKFVDSLSTANLDDLSRAKEQCDLEVLLRFCLEQGLPQKNLFSELWRILGGHEDPDRFLSSPSTSTALWNHVPLSTLVARVHHHLTVCWEAILPHQFADLLTRLPLSHLPLESLVHCPLDALLTHLESGRPETLPRPTLLFVLERAGARIGPYVNKLLAEGPTDSLRSILDATPTKAGAELVATLPDEAHLLRLKPPSLHLLRAFLMRLVHARIHGFETAARLLFSLETQLTALRTMPLEQPKVPT